MDVVIVGCGRVGVGLASTLDAQGHRVAVIDRDHDALHRRFGADFGGVLVQGSGLDRGDLANAGAHHADAFVAVTDGDNTNIVAARIAREHFGIAEVIARIYDPVRAAAYQRLGIPTIATVEWTTGQILRRLLPVTTPPVWSDPHGQVDLRPIPAPGPWAGHPYRSFGSANTFSAVAVSRDARTHLIDDTTICQEGDTVFVLVHTAAADSLATHLDRPGQR